MKDSKTDELLSAFFDGELSDRERAAVERWMQSHPESREQIDDYRRLSRLFEGLSRTEVPQEFSTEVLQLAERRMLLPDAPAWPRRREIRAWWLAVPAAAAAIVVLIVNITMRHGGPPELADRGPGREALPAPAAGGPDAGVLTGIVSNDRPTSPAPDLAIPLAATASIDETDGAPAAGLIARGKARAKNNADSDASFAEADSSEATTNRLMAEVVDEALFAPEESEIKEPALPVVKVVVDTMDGLALLQQLFADDQVVAQSSDLGDEAAGSKPEPLDAGARSAGQAPALCVVVTEPDKIVRVFSKMMRARHPVLRIEAQEPIIIAALDRDSQERFAQAEKEVSRSLGEAFDRNADRGTSADSAPASGEHEADPRRDGSARRRSDAKSPSALPGRRRSGSGMPGLPRGMRSGVPEVETSRSVKPPEEKIEADESTDDEAPAAEAVSRQVVVAVPSNLWNRDRNRGSSERGDATIQRGRRNSSTAAIDDKTAAKRSGAAGEGPTEAHRVVRMLIMIEHALAPPAAAAPVDQ